MMRDTNSCMWMTLFLRSPDQEKQKQIAELRENTDPTIMESIRFHLGMRDELHLLVS